ncbi:MAG: copper resistance protein CopD [Gemmatimonadales bacterium]|nr:copper resistance protein CopD [Gemmatimonadales bacterium]MBT3498537.1 copper resistance protein CopD [Gemmatimonadales bacterium]MBT3776316.1 copper resistance protein CopD [Gemmatimonadales bacterium]MBT3958926.1 copper resistance protein CopD [Gemmatimonadales bacterium]MBT4436321.1 copper resistance protein CopD [Gemmatimonadales bacterium]
MTNLYFIVVTVHVLAAIVWLGGMIFFALVAPILRQIEDDAFRAQLFDRLGRRFRVVGWVCIGAMVLTGVEQLRARGWWGTDVWGAEGFWSTRLGGALRWKLAIVAFMIVVQGVHDFWLGPAAGRTIPGSQAAGDLRVRASWLARINAVAAVLLVYFAVRVARGG